MAATAVERPMTAQERVLSANNPPPRSQVSPQPNYHQRAALNNRGTGVAAYFGDERRSDEQPLQKSSQSHRTQPHPSEFFSGPTEPGHVKHGVRRYDERNGATVGLALTEEWIRGYAEDEEPPRHAVKQRGPKGNLEGPSCSIKTEEPKPRPMRAPGASHHGHSRVAPYHESEVQQEPLPKEPVAGKRRFQTKTNGDIISTPVPGQAAEECAGVPDKFGNPPAHPSSRKNKANESRDVLNLGRYSAEQLSETERKVVLGPREFTPQNLPPRQRPTLARVKSAANETHDIFGTGQGAKDTEVTHCKRRGANAPKSSSHVNLFDNTPLPEKAPAKAYRKSDLLDYNEAKPRVTFRAAKKEEETPVNAEPTRLTKSVESGSLFTPSKKNDTPDAHRGRGRGKFTPKDNAIF